MKTFKQIREQTKQELFTDDQLNDLKQRYGAIDKIDVTSPTYEKLVKFMDGLPQENLKQIRDAKIKFLRHMAHNRIKDDLSESAPPDPEIEKWIKANKAKFKKEYGAEKGEEILYAKAWKMHNSKKK